MYWIVVIAGFAAMRFHEVKGHWPLLKAKKHSSVAESDMTSRTPSADGVFMNDKKAANVSVKPSSARTLSDSD